MFFERHFYHEADINHCACHTSLTKSLFIDYFILTIQKEYPEFLVRDVADNWTQVTRHIVAARNLFQFKRRRMVSTPAQLDSRDNGDRFCLADSLKLFKILDTEFAK